MDPDELNELETEEEPGQYQAKNYLSDMVVQTVGLVRAGANLIPNFIVLKNLDKEEETTMPDELIVEEVNPETEPITGEGYWKRFKTEVGKLVKASGPPVETEVPPAAPVVNLEAIVKAQTDRFEALLKAQKAEFDQQVGEMKGQLEKANERAEKAEQYAAGQTLEKEANEFLQKALNFKAVPLAPVELGKMLHTIYKAVNKETYDQLAATLGAMDQQAFTAGLFKEVGTARTPAEANLEAKVERIAKEQNISYADALLSLPAHEQRQLIGEV